MSDNRAAFIYFKEISKGTWLVAIANKQNLWYLGKKNIKIKRQAHDKWLVGIFHDVLYISDLRTNLFSVGKASDRGVVTIYKKNTRQMIGDNGDGDILLTWIHTGINLYKLQLKVVIITNEKNSCAYKVSNTISEGNTSTRIAEESNKHGKQNFIKKPQKTTIELWHHKFYHINTHALRQTEQVVCSMLMLTTDV